MKKLFTVSLILALLGGSSAYARLDARNENYCRIYLDPGQILAYAKNESSRLRNIVGSPSQADMSEYMIYRLSLIGVYISEDRLPQTPTFTYISSLYPTSQYAYYRIGKGDYFQNPFGPYGRAVVIDRELKRQVVNVADYVIVDRFTFLAAGTIDWKTEGFRAFGTNTRPNFGSAAETHF